MILIEFKYIHYLHTFNMFLHDFIEMSRAIHCSNLLSGSRCVAFAYYTKPQQPILMYEKYFE